MRCTIKYSKANYDNVQLPVVLTNWVSSFDKALIKAGEKNKWVDDSHGESVNAS